MVIGLCDRMAVGWLDEFKRGCERLDLSYRIIRMGDDDWMDQAQGLSAFVWRVIMGDPSCMAEAHAKIPMLEAMGIPCFPNERMLWLYNDKIRETLFLRRHRFPTPRTWVFFEQSAAQKHVANATYPMVTKSHCGASSSGVALLRSPKEGSTLVSKIFRGMTFWDKALAKFYFIPRLKKGDLLLQLRYCYRDSWPRYAYFQEFIHTDCDWRITTLGENLVSVFVRKNRPHDFRASGSGLWEKVEICDLPTEACDLALHISNTHGFTSMTYDFMHNGDRWLIGEISYAFVLNNIYSQTLFLRENGQYLKADPAPIGVMHLRALLKSASKPEGKPDTQDGRHKEDHDG
jgi:glutathione synthase/RimK-type ligase-like ATP-grasp enzyme